MKLKYLALLLINPFLYIMLWLVIMLVWQRLRKKRYILLLAMLFYLFTASYTADLFLNLWYLDDTYDKKRKYDAVVVLLGVSDHYWYRHKNNEKVFNNYYRFNKNRDRVVEAVRIMKKGKVKELLLGDLAVESFSETSLVNKFVISQGVRKNRITVYGKVNRTVDEAKGVKKYTKKHSLKKILIITSAVHMRRAYTDFRREGLAPDIYSVNRRVALFKWQGLIPHPKGSANVLSLFYEIAGYTVSWVESLSYTAISK